MKTANKSYKETKKNIRLKITELNKLLLKHSEQQSKDPKCWGLVGDLEYVYSRLADITEFLKGEQ